MNEKLIEAIVKGDLENVRVHLKDLSDLNEEFYFSFDQYMEKTTLLCLAAHFATLDLSIVQELLNAGVEIDYFVFNHGTALCRACGVGNDALVECFLGYGASAWPIKQVGRNFLLSETEESKRLQSLSQWTVGEVGRQPEGTIPLFMAAKGGSVPCIEKILAQGFPFDFVNDASGNEEKTALHFATESPMVMFLTGLGLRGEYPQYSSNDPLHNLLDNEDWDAARALIESLSEKERNQLVGEKFILFSGYSDMSLEALKFLINLGADPLATDHEGIGTALHWCVWQGTSDEVFSEGELVDVLTFLLEQGIDPNAKRAGGIAPLHDAVSGDWGNATAVHILIQHGAHIDVLNDEGESPLILACRQSELACIRLLLDANADHMIADHMGNTALSELKKLLGKKTCKERSTIQQYADLIERNGP